MLAFLSFELINKFRFMTTKTPHRQNSETLNKERIFQPAKTNIEKQQQQPLLLFQQAQTRGERSQNRERENY